MASYLKQSKRFNIIKTFSSIIFSAASSSYHLTGVSLSELQFYGKLVSLFETIRARNSCARLSLGYYR